MIEALLKRKFTQTGMNNVLVQSAGLLEVAKEKHSANPKSVETMKKMGVDITAHRSTWIGDLDLSEFFLILTVGESEASQIRGMLNSSNAQICIVGGKRSTPNPWQKDQGVYDKTGEAVFTWIEQEADKICKMVG